MEYSPGCVFSLAEKNAPIPGCTVSEAICSGETDVVCYSLAAGTDISAEIYFSPKLLIVAEGTLEVGCAQTHPPFILKSILGGISQ